MSSRCVYETGINRRIPRLALGYKPAMISSFWSRGFAACIRVPELGKRFKAVSGCSRAKFYVYCNLRKQSSKERW